MLDFGIGARTWHHRSEMLRIGCNVEVCSILSACDAGGLGDGHHGREHNARQLLDSVFSTCPGKCPQWGARSKAQQLLNSCSSGRDAPAFFNSGQSSRTCWSIRAKFGHSSANFDVGCGLASIGQIMAEIGAVGNGPSKYRPASAKLGRTRAQVGRHLVNVCPTLGAHLGSRSKYLTIVGQLWISPDFHDDWTTV